MKQQALKKLKTADLVSLFQLLAKLSETAELLDEFVEESRYRKQDMDDIISLMLGGYAAYVIYINMIVEDTNTEEAEREVERQAHLDA